MNMSLDSRFYRILDMIYKFMQINFLMLMGSLGIVTIGASLSATAYISKKLIEGKDVNIIGDFKKSYLENLKSGVILSVFFIASIIGTGWGRSISGIYMYVQIYLVCLFMVATYLIGNYRMKVKSIVLSAFRILNGNLLILLPMAGVFYILKLMLAFNFVLFILLGSSLGIFGINALIYIVIKREERNKAE